MELCKSVHSKREGQDGNFGICPGKNVRKEDALRSCDWAVFPKENKHAKNCRMTQTESVFLSDIQFRTNVESSTPAH